ncbi:Putative LOC100748690 [Caligus rogercresseyi]|uniref:LOC100748690 n=1 Tax=Caligus rogercresseyi TaxID=217165 RepID=A0A7T8KC83_CALRO|nr:Putative LOC100748690 [Caligus rogercresseyi]
MILRKHSTLGTYIQGKFIFGLTRRKITAQGGFRVGWRPLRPGGRGRVPARGAN